MCQAEHAFLQSQTEKPFDPAEGMLQLAMNGYDTVIYRYHIIIIADSFPSVSSFHESFHGRQYLYTPKVWGMFVVRACRNVLSLSSHANLSKLLGRNFSIPRTQSKRFDQGLRAHWNVPGPKGSEQTATRGVHFR